MARETAVESVGAAPEGGPGRRFRVIHGAVGGVKRTPDGRSLAHDYVLGEVVEESQLDGAAPFYFSMGALEILD